MNWFEVMEHICADMTVQPGYQWECPRGCEDFWKDMEDEEDGGRRVGSGPRAHARRVRRVRTA